MPGPDSTKQLDSFVGAELLGHRFFSMETPEFALLRTFQSLFEGTRYKHRDSSLGDFVASHLYEDLVTLNKSATLTRRVQTHECVVNLANKTVGKPSRRGDG